MIPQIAPEVFARFVVIPSRNKPPILPRIRPRILLNSAATAYVVDIHSKLPFLSMKSGLRTAQLATLLFGITGIAFAYVMATWEVKSLWDEFNKILVLILGSMGGT